ncbi:hypothetical protein C6Y45_08965 [Alkalicoccus saliphilus]|uniref:Uncharacterized protein n=1 Tax=Alkalicoccus saliphilus TaxID=200989 RepID=A0A2T4U695_9BACI|nr:hypothetical protein C6Y45_08965 [Alkalicoccus saliphilus]
MFHDSSPFYFCTQKGQGNSPALPKSSFPPCCKAALRSYATVLYLFGKDPASESGIGFQDFGGSTFYILSLPVPGSSIRLIASAPPPHCA